MSGIYIHIPFCRQACNYCNFHFSVSQKNRPDFISALKKEIEITKDFYSHDNTNSKICLDTLYFGGGTPSVLSINELADILDSLKKYYSFDEKTEITLEANPDDLSLSKLQEIKGLGINRLSIGIQSFHNADLKYLNRSHSSQQAEECIINAIVIGFENISIDLIYGIPTLSDNGWESNLKKTNNLNIPHISAYALTVENKTPLDLFIRKGQVQAVSDEDSARQFDIMQEWMEKHAYVHYEISNFGKSGFFSKHNVSYWTGKPYLGLGPAAHSFTPGKRFWNISNTSKYIHSIKNVVLPREIELLTISQQVNEYVMTSLRTMWGCDLVKIKTEFGKSYYDAIISSSNKFISKELLMLQNNKLTLSKKGKFLGDGIAADLFVD